MSSTEAPLTLEAQVICTFCGARHLTLATEGHYAGQESRQECLDCGWLTLHRIAVLYDPDEYSLADPYGPGLTVRSRCIDCGETYYSDLDECYSCGGVRFNRWVESNGGAPA